jgi:DNA replication initiation complex subunit (GINS family)
MSRAYLFVGNMLMPRDIVKQYRKEKEQKVLTKLDDDFYLSARKLIDSLAMNVAKLKSEGKSDKEISEAAEDVENARKIVLDIVRMRRKKIVDELFSSILISSGRPAADLPNTTPEERQWCNSLLDATQTYNMAVMREILESGRVAEELPVITMPAREKEEAAYEDVPLAVAVVDDDLEPSVDNANFQWSGIPAGAIVGAPKEMINNIVNKGKAKILFSGEPSDTSS